MIAGQRSLLPFVLFLFLSAFSFAQRPPKDKILDKKTFTIIMRQKEENEKKRKEPFDDELNFRSNKAWSKVMQGSDNGMFLRGDYVVSKEEVLGESVYRFQIINKNAKGMSLKWEGKVFGDQIEGTAIISKKGNVKDEYTFSGTLAD